jgi:hypothetical protein
MRTGFGPDFSTFKFTAEDFSIERFFGLIRSCRTVDLYHLLRFPLGFWKAGKIRAAAPELRQHQARSCLRVVQPSSPASFVHVTSSVQDV